MATVLIVDDDADNREILSRLLAMDGHTTIGASDGKQAIDLLASERPALVILDIRMPTMDGIEFLAVIRSYLRWQSLPVIVLSGVPEEDRKRAARYGVDQILEKGSINFDGLKAVIRAALSDMPADSALSDLPAPPFSAQ